MLRIRFKWEGNGSVLGKGSVLRIRFKWEGKGSELGRRF